MVRTLLACVGVMDGLCGTHCREGGYECVWHCVCVGEEGSSVRVCKRHMYLGLCHYMHTVV